MFKFKSGSEFTDMNPLADKIFELLSVVYSSSPWTYNQILSELTKPEVNCQLVFDETSKLIGFMTVQFLSDEAEITNLAVLPTYQEKKVATTLLSALVKNFEGTIFLEVRASNESAQNLYKKFGFITFYSRKNYYQNPSEDALLMKKIKMNDTYILAFESSCDETSVAILKNGTELLANVIATQIASHKRFGGVVPEVASRHHTEQITYCIDAALYEANIKPSQITAVAVTKGPGLVGALLVGMTAAKAFAWAYQLPLIGVNHMAGHLMAANLVAPIEYPALALLVSGGHTELVYVAEEGDYKILGETRDDAVGEAYDKVGRVIGLTYPSGKVIDELAHRGKDIYNFPRAMIHEPGFEFSFSGLKSSFINLVHNAEQHGEVLKNEDLAASFQAAVLDVLLSKTQNALTQYSEIRTLIVAGGVAANQGLRERLEREITETKVIIPPLRLCGDNAGMIATAAYTQYKINDFITLSENAFPSLSFEE